MGSPHQSDSMPPARDVCEGICSRKLVHFSCHCKYGVLFFGDDRTGLAGESKRTKRILEWSRQIMGRGLLLFPILLLCEITTSFV